VPATVEDLIALLQLAEVDADTFVGREADTALQRVFGGQVAAQALTAADRTVTSDYVAHRLHAAFLAR
jgi:acyl-CoA thioesterase II